VTSGLRTSIQNDIASANNVIKSAIDAVNKVNPFGDISVPQINVPSLDALQNVTLPPSFEDALTKLNASLPSVADIKDKLEDVYVFILSSTNSLFRLSCPALTHLSSS